MAPLSTPAAPLLGIIAPPNCYFTDALSAEIRIRIYEYVFGPENYVQRLRFEDESKYYCKGFRPEEVIGGDMSVDYRAKREECEDFNYLHTSILAVSKLVHAEALETFYKVKIIRTTFGGFTSLMYLEGHYDLIRNVEITHCDRIGRPYYMHEAMQDAQFLPQLESFTILAEFLRPHGQTTGSSVRQFAREYGFGEVSCTGVGNYSLSGRYSMIQIAQSDIRVMWPNVASTPAEYDAVEELSTIISEWDLSSDYASIVPWACHTSLRLWIAMLQLSLEPRRPNSSGSDSDDNQEENILLRYFLSSLRSGFPERLRENFIELGKPMSQLTSEDDPHLLGSFTEWLAVAMRQWWDIDSGYFHDQPFEPQWVELGRISQGAERAERKRAYENSLISHPVCPSHRQELQHVRQDLLNSEEIKGLLGATFVMDCSRTVLQQTYYLCLAVGWLMDDSEYWGEDAIDWNRLTAFDIWSLGLLRKYLMFAEVARDSALYSAGLCALRATFSFAMRTSYSRKQYARDMVNAVGATRAITEQQTASATQELESGTGQEANEAITDGTVSEEEDRDEFKGLVYLPIAQELGPFLLEAEALHRSLT